MRRVLVKDLRVGDLLLQDELETVALVVEIQDDGRPLVLNLLECRSPYALYLRHEDGPEGWNFIAENWDTVRA